MICVKLDNSNIHTFTTTRMVRIDLLMLLESSLDI